MGYGSLEAGSSSKRKMWWCCKRTPLLIALGISLIVAGFIYAERTRRRTGDSSSPTTSDGGAPNTTAINDTITTTTTAVPVPNANICKTPWSMEEQMKVCHPWCMTSQDHDEFVCGFEECIGCSFCPDHEQYVSHLLLMVAEGDENENNSIMPPTTTNASTTPETDDDTAGLCSDYCTSPTSDDETSCNFDTSTKTCAGCSCSTFVDVTDYVLPKVDGFFHQWYHNGKPYPHENSPIFLDINGDGYLEYFDSLHAHPLANKDITFDGNKRFELTESVVYNDNDNEDGEDEKNFRAFPNMRRFRHLDQRIFVEGETDKFSLDPHGQNILDLDGDGVVDMMISSGGGRGDLIEGDPYAKSKNNFLLWGEKKVTSGEADTVPIFRGGREAAEAAGVEQLYGRGRVNYMMDINNDGQIDIFNFQGRPITNMLIPGVMLFNNGNRTWSKDMPSTNSTTTSIVGGGMSEYTIAMVLTDADGDGLAQELVLGRSFCYPQREGPDTDPNFEDYGPFSEEVEEFCKTRPVGSIAVYKYNATTERMQEISPRATTSSAPEVQPAKCPHGTWVGLHDCNAKSMSTADFDGDLIADLMVFYLNKIEFFYSTDRLEEKKEGEDVLSYTKPSTVIDFGNEEGCRGGGQVARIVDLNNDGTQQVMVMCSYAIGTFLLYSRDDETGEWSRDLACNDDAFGDMNDPMLSGPSATDYEHMCNCLEHECKDFEPAQKACSFYKGETDEALEVVAMSLSPIDLNNDGFVDFVTTHDYGYLRFYHNIPGPASRKNRFITFQLVGGAKAGNMYGIGATVILYGERLTEDGNKVEGKPYHQFHEKSTYQHTPDKFGSIDDRITFGLGTDIYPLNVTVRWSNGHETVQDLATWQFEPETYPVIVVGDE